MTGKPKAKTEDCRELWRILSDGQWHLGREIPMNNRMIRAVCAEKPEHFLSSQKGYKLVKYATDDEIDIAIADLRSRIRHLDDRAGALEFALTQRHNRQLAV